jgi:nucleoside-diphosphate-sugar epimerase
MKILIVGGAGNVSSIIRPALEAQHEVCFFDIRPVPGAENRSFVGSVTDPVLMAKAMAGCDAAIWVAMAPWNDKEDPISPHYKVEVQGFSTVLKAAIKAGVRRIVHSSSLSVYNHLDGRAENPYPVTESRPADSWHPYGLGKQLGEELGRLYVRSLPGATIVSLRLMKPMTAAQFATQQDKLPPNWSALGPDDTSRLYQAALACAIPGAHVVQATGDLTDKFFPNHQARILLGWEPRGQ